MLLGLSGYQQPSEYPYLSCSERSLQCGLLSAWWSRLGALILGTDSQDSSGWWARTQWINMRNSWAKGKGWMDGQTDNVLPVLKQVVFCLEWKKTMIFCSLSFFFFKLIAWYSGAYLDFLRIFFYRLIAWYSGTYLEFPRSAGWSRRRSLEEVWVIWEILAKPQLHIDRGSAYKDMIK